MVDPDKNDGKRGLTKDARKALSGRQLTVACGKCIDCRLSYAREWALRCMHEQQTSGDSIFVTLTYDDDHLPDDWNLHYKHYQLFMHKLRKRVPHAGRFFMCGEYGETNFRPHFHAILFNCDFADKVYYKTVDGVKYYTSEKLAQIWGHGFCLIGDVTLASAGYVARYNLKKITGPAAGAAYQFVTPDGVIVDRRPPFSESSLRPGIGYEWFQRYHSDVFPCDYMVHAGRKFPVPRYYTKLYEALSADDAEAVKKVRRAGMKDRKHHPDFTSRRLRDKNEVALLNARQKRDLK